MLQTTIACLIDNPILLGYRLCISEVSALGTVFLTGIMETTDGFLVNQVKSKPPKGEFCEPKLWR